MQTTVCGKESVESMHSKHNRKAPWRLALRTVLACILTLVFCVSSFTTVMANTVSAYVIDGGESFQFAMSSQNLNDILAEAEEWGMKPLGPLDVAEQVENTTTVNVRRGASITVYEAGKQTNLLAYCGDTVEKTLADNNIIMKDEDQVTPARGALISAGMKIEILRSCKITVTADGKSQTYQLTNATVQDALNAAGVTVGEQDSVNYDVDEPLFDKMHIRVSRLVTITVTADGETKTYQTSGSTVEAALKHCGIQLSADDRLNVSRAACPTDGMEITVTRVETHEETKTETIDYLVEYQDTEALYEGETELITQGQSGEKEVTYKLIYVGGELVDREVVSEQVICDPISAVYLRGTGKRTQSSTTLQPSGGTGTDYSGASFSYSKKITGTCTAYSPETTSEITAMGNSAGYGCIAVNPNIIPYGTRLYITSPDGSIVYGYGIANDTGTAAMNGDIKADLCYDTEAECVAFGRREMVIYILD